MKIGSDSHYFQQKAQQVENVPIRLQVFFGGKRIDFTTGYRIDAVKWDSAKQQNYWVYRKYIPDSNNCLYNK